MSFAFSAFKHLVHSALAAALLSPCLAAGQTPTPFFGTPTAIPGIIQAEDFDRGGQGVAYNDTAAANDGGQYRTTEGVDIFTSSGAPNGYVIKNFALGEWMTYTVEVAANGWYDFQVRMASKVDTARFHIEFDGVDVTGTVIVPVTSTTTWEAYDWFVVKKRVPLTKGTHVMKIVSDAEWVGLDAFNITASPVGMAFGGTPAAVPGVIQAENFNDGGQGVAYNDTDTVNDGTQYRPGEGVDIFTSPGSPDYIVKNFASSEWMVYSVNVPTTGMYDFKVRVATKVDTSRFHIEVDGVNVTGTVAVAATSTTSWDNFQWIVARMLVPLEAGTRNLAIVSDEGWLGLDALELVADPLRPFSGTPAAVPGTIEVENFDLGGEGVAYHDTTPTVNDGGQYRASEGVDIFTSSGAPGGYVIKNFPAGEWMAYTINVQSAGQYDFKVRLASKVSTSTFHIEIDGADVTGTVAVPQTSTTTWEEYQWYTAKTNVPLTAGTHVLKIASDTEWVGLDTLELVASVAPPTGEVKFFCSFETGWTQCGFGEQKKDDGQPRASIVNIGRHGTTAVRLHTNPGDNNINNSGTWERDDLILGPSPEYCNEGQEEWWSVSTRFPDDFVVPLKGVVMAFHHSGSTGQANFQIFVQPDGLTFAGAGGANVVIHSTDPGNYGAFIGPLVRNQWYDFVYHVKWSSGSDGFMHAWVNGEKKLTHIGPTLYVGQTCYLKLSNYHEPTAASSVIHDRVVRGTSAESVSLTPLQP